MNKRTKKATQKIVTAFDHGGCICVLTDQGRIYRRVLIEKSPDPWSIGWAEMTLPPLPEIEAEAK